MAESIESKVRQIIVDELSVDEKEVTLNADFIHDLGADSLDTVEVVMRFEEEFGIEIPDETAEKIKTVGDAIKYIEAHLTEASETTGETSKHADSHHEHKASHHEHEHKASHHEHKAKKH